MAYKAGIKAGWAYFQFKEMCNREPTKEEFNHPPIVPTDDLVLRVSSRLSEYRRSRLLNALEYSKTSEAEKRVQRKIKAQAYRELDHYRPKLENL